MEVDEESKSITLELPAQFVDKNLTHQNDFSHKICTRTAPVSGEDRNIGKNQQT